MKTKNSGKKSESKSIKPTVTKIKNSISTKIDVNSVEGGIAATDERGNKGHVVGNAGNGLA